MSVFKKKNSKIAKNEFFKYNCETIVMDLNVAEMEFARPLHLENFLRDPCMGMALFDGSHSQFRTFLVTHVLFDKSMNNYIYIGRTFDT